MFSDDDALKITRMASHVCRDWRNSMLSTPSLWAKLIDLNSLYGAADAWRNELMRRSGAALLWIKARHFWKDTTGIIPFFLAVVSENWPRIQKLVVGIEVMPIHPILYLPAPNLQTFDLSFCYTPRGRAEEEDAQIGPLFSNNAPSLREFYSRRYRFDLNAAWLHQLHLIEIDITLTLDELLTTLTVASNLKHLLLDVYFEEVSPLLPIVSMPNLSSLTLLGYLERDAILLNHLELPPDCTLKLHFRTEVVAYSELEDTYCPAVQKISSLAQDLFRTYPPQKLLLECHSHEIALKDKTQAEEPCFDFQIYFKYTLDPESLSYAHSIFLGEFSLPELSEITEIYLQNLEFPSIPIHRSYSRL